MKIGIFVSTQIRESVKITRRNLFFLKEAFPTGELVAGAWDYQESLAFDYVDLAREILIIKEPIIDYEPYIDNPKAVLDYQYQKKLKQPNERHKHQTKQMLAHDALMRKYGKDYDIIVRARWDTAVAVNLDFSPILDEVMNTPTVVGMCTRKDYHTDIMILGESSSSDYPYLKHRNSKTNAVTTSKTCEMFLDSGILIHRAEDWNSNLVQTLHESKKLLAAEFGWYQILVEGTAHHNWKHYDGGAAFYRTVGKEEKELLNKYEMLCNNDY